AGRAVRARRARRAALAGGLEARRAEALGGRRAALGARRAGEARLPVLAAGAVCAVGAGRAGEGRAVGRRTVAGTAGAKRLGLVGVAVGRAWQRERRAVRAVRVHRARRARRRLPPLALDVVAGGTLGAHQGRAAAAVRRKAVVARAVLAVGGRA